MSWFNRLLHRDAETVRIMPDHVDSAQHDADDRATSPAPVAAEEPQEKLSERRDEEAPQEERAFATAYANALTARIHEEAPFEQTVKEEGAESAAKAMPEQIGATDRDDAGDVSFVKSTEPRREPGCLEEDKHREVAAMPTVQSSHQKQPTESVVRRAAEQPSRQRPQRPLSFHELAGVKEKSEVSTSISPGSARYQLTGESQGRQEEAADLTMLSQERSPHPALVELAVAPEVLPRDAVIAGAPTLSERAPNPLRPGDLQAEDEVSPEPFALSKPPGTSRWDPIPTLRPTDSGWNRIAAAISGSPQEPLAADHWTWPGPGTEDVEDQELARWTSELESAAKLDPAYDANEPALSRPWGLLSRFQQMQKIAPKPEAMDPRTQEGSGESAVPGTFKAG